MRIVRRIAFLLAAAEAPFSRRWRAALLVCAGAALDEGPVSLGFVDWQSQGPGAGSTRRERHDRSHQSR